MGLIEILILAIIQGVTEFLPVSSSGHLVIAAAVMDAAGYEAPGDLIGVNIVLHLGTLLAVLVFYVKEIARLATRDRRVIPRLVVGTLPAVVVVLALKKLVPEMPMLESPLVAGLMLPLTGALLIWATRARRGETDYVDLGYRQALWIGLLQAVAILPGISRSGATITAGLAVGLRRESAATFAFLLAIPAIGGAGLFEVLRHASSAESATAPAYLVLGAAVSFLSGWLSLKWLIAWIHRGRLALFAWWCIPLGVLVTAWQLWQLSRGG